MADTRSALKRTILAAGPSAYWPLEDSADATSGGSAVSGGSPMQARNVEFGAVSSLAGSGSTPDLATGNGQLVASLAGGSRTTWGLGFVALDSGPEDPLLEMTVASSTHASWKLFAPTLGDANYYLTIRDSASATTASLSFAGTVNAGTTWHHYGITAEQSGANVTVKLYIDGTLVDTDTSAGTLAPLGYLVFNPQSTNQISSIAHVEAYNTASTAGAAAMNGYAGETGTARFARLCTEAGIAYNVAT